jgi:hypothetical protein
LSQPARELPAASETHASRLPWWLALTGIAAGALAIILIARLGGDPAGPLSTLAVPPPPPASERAAVRLERFEYQAVTRTGDRWQVTAADLQSDGGGMLLERPVLELFRGSRPEVRLLASQGRLAGSGQNLELSGDVILRVGDDFLVRAEALTFSPEGIVRGAGTVSVRTPRGVSTGRGIKVEPAEGKVVLSPGTADEQVIRWTGWGRDLADMGEAVRNWSRASGLEDDAEIQKAADR